MHTISFDVSKHELVGLRMSKRGIIQERFQFPNTKEAIASFLDALPDERITVGSEATAEYHNALAQACLARGIPFRLINPIVTKQFTKATVRKRKTDRQDAEIIARCLLQGAGREVAGRDFEPPMRILRTAADLSQMAVAVKCKHQRFEEHFPETVATQEVLAAVEEALSKAADALRREGARAAPKRERELIGSIPGFGAYLAAVVVAEIGDYRRFPGGKQLVAYAGLDPKVKQSGRVLAQNTRITKRGSPYLRRALYIAASIAQRHDPELKAYFMKKRSEGKRYKEATVANARHLVHRIHAVLKRGAPYVPAISPAEI